MFRSYIRKVHLWIGLSLGLLFVLIGLTGSILVYKDQLVQLLHPRQTVVDDKQTRASLESILQSVRKRHPESNIQLIQLPSNPRESIEFRTSEDRKRYYADPYTGEILGFRNMKTDLVGWIHSFHIELMAGPTGKTVLGTLGSIYIVLLTSGLFLWWPGTKKLQRGITMKLSTNWKGIIFDTHQTVGFYASAFLFLSVLTGLSLCFYGTSRAFLESLFGKTEQPSATLSEQRNKEQKSHSLPLDKCLKTSRKKASNCKMTWVYLPASPGQPITVRYRHPTEYHPNGNSKMYFDPDSGELIGTSSIKQQKAGTRLYHFLYPLHAGFFGGVPVDLLMVVLGVLPTFLFGTGVGIWWNRKNSRRKTS